jgi:Domain of unknown function (DUF4136)
MISRFSACLSAVVACFAIQACSTGPAIRADADPSANFANYKTFAFFDRVATDGSGYGSLITQHLKGAAQREMEKRGYQMVSANPQLLVNFNLNIENRTDIRSTPTTTGGYYGYRAGYYSMWAGYPQQSVETVHYQAGTLAVDVVDAAQKRLVWSGVAEGKVSKKAAENPGPAIDGVVASIFEKYPVPAPGPAAK